MPKVSAVIPTRNRPELVLRAVHSALGQTLKDIEVIVVIDGIDAASRTALAAVDDSRLRVIALDESVGGSEARNLGAREARSPWVALLDDDDEWLPAKLEMQLACAEALPHEMAIITSKYILRFSDSDQVWPLRFPLPNEPLSEYFFCTSRNLFQTSTLMCSRALLMRTPFTFGLKRLQDWDWMLRVALHKDLLIGVVPEVLSIYNVNGEVGTISRSLDWEGSMLWAKNNRNLMTPRAYSAFIAKKCAPEAAQQRAGFKAIPLFLECVLGGRFSFNAVLKFLVYFFLTPNQRRRLGDRIF